jgi:hypothetical protein
MSAGEVVVVVRCCTQNYSKHNAVPVNASTFVPKFLQIYNKGVYFKELMVRRHRSMCGNIYKKCIPIHPLKTTCRFLEFHAICATMAKILPS